jgi:hypothetical protein
MTKLISGIVGVIAILSALFGVYSYMDTKYALAAELNEIKKRLDYKITTDQLNSTQERIWRLEDRAQGKRMDSITNEEYRKLQSQKEQLNQQIKVLEKK